MSGKSSKRLRASMLVLNPNTKDGALFKNHTTRHEHWKEMYKLDKSACRKIRRRKNRS